MAKRSFASKAWKVKLRNAYVGYLIICIFLEESIILLRDFQSAEPSTSLVQLFVQSVDFVDASLNLCMCWVVNEGDTALLCCLQRCNSLIKSSAQCVITTVVVLLHDGHQRVSYRSCSSYITCAIERVLDRVDVVLIVDE